MMPESIFSIANFFALASWLLLVVFPNRKVTQVVVRSGAVPILLSSAYLALIVLFFTSAEGGFGALPDVQLLFTNRWVALAGWLHYLAFDLLVGTWEVQEALVKKIPHLLVIPCLVATFLFGPVGFLLFFVLRFVVGKEVKDGPETV